MNMDKTDEAIEDVKYALELMLKYNELYNEAEDLYKVVQLKVKYIYI